MIRLLFGRDRFLKGESVAELKTRLFRNPSELELNFQSFQAGEQALAGVLDFLLTAPFLAASRLAVLWGVENLSEEEGQRLEAALESGLPESAVLVMETEEANTRKDPRVRELAEFAEAVACHPPFEKDLPYWVENRARKKGLTLEGGVSLFLIQRVGRELAALDSALEELQLFIHPRPRASQADAAAIAPSNPEEDVFRLADFVIENRKKEALGALDGLYQSGTKGPEIVAALSGQLERYKKALASTAAGRSPLEIGEELRVHRMFQPAFFGKLKRLSPQRIRAMQKALLECDEAFKTGQAQERLAIERFILTTS